MSVTQASPSPGRISAHQRALHRPATDPRRFAIVAATTILVALAAVIITLVRPTTYSSTTTFVLQSDASASQTETLVRNMIALVPDVTIASDLQRATGARLQPSQIASDISVTRPPGSSVLTISYADDDEQRSRDIVAALSPVLSNRVSQLFTTGGAAPAFALVEWGGGDITTTRQSPPVLRNGALGLVVGLALGLLVSVFVSPAGRRQD